MKEEKQSVVYDFKRNLNKIMQEKGVTQAQLSRETGISPATICNILAFNNSRTVHIETLQIISEALSVSYDDLLRHKE